MPEPTKTSARASLARVFTNPNLRRVQLAFAGSVMGDWAYATGVTVWAFTEGGAAAVGIFQGVRFITGAVAGPLGAAVADRVSRRTFMMVNDAIRAVVVGIAAVTIAVGGPSFLVYALAVVAGMVGASFRSAQAGLVPQLVSTPAELTAANAVASNLETVAMFAGPAIGALLVGFVGVEAVFWLNVATFTWSFVMIGRVRVPGPAPTWTPENDESDESDEGAGAADEAPSDGFVRELTAGFATIARNPDLAVVSLFAAAQGLIWGALTVFMVIVSVTMLDAGAEGVGYLNAIMGVATVAGGAAVLTRVGKGRLGQDMAIGVLGWSLPLVALAAFPSPVTAVAALAVIGLMDPWVNLGLDTIPQRLAPGHLISRVFAAVESALIGSMALGAFLAPVLVQWIGFREAMAALGVAVSLFVLAAFGRMRRLDSRLTEPDHLPLLRSMALFAPLAPAVLETLARELQAVSVPAGETILRENETSDRFYVISSGSVEVTQAGRSIRVETAGDFFGEIGLLRDVPRTATVTAVSDTELLVLERGHFLAAVTGVQEAATLAEEIVSQRLAV